MSPVLTKVSTYIKARYGKGGACRNTIKRMIKDGELPGKKEGTRWYVWTWPDLTPAYGFAEEGEQPKPQQEQQPITSTGNSVADAILKKHDLAA